jgi:undecaprenyl-diphosphatase
MALETLIALIVQYGYVGLYGLLAISIVGPPIPDEFLMTFVGFLSSSGQINPLWAITAAASGSITGITITYFIGRFFHDRILPRLEKHVGTARLEKALHWYQWNGAILLIIGYFIPGVRHLTGYISGMSHLSYRRFALFAYSGAILWASFFIILGRLLGNRWESILPLIHRYTLAIVLGVLLIALVVVVFKYRQVLWTKFLYWIKGFRERKL